MATTNGNRKLLDLKRWEMVTPAPAATVAAAAVISSRCYRQQQLYVQAATVAYLYAPNEDGWVQVPSPALAGTWSAGGAGVGGSFSTGTTVAALSLTATGGTTTTIITNQTLARSIAGYNVHILSGPNAGVTLPILSNTVGATATITVAAQASAFTASTVYRIIAPVWYVLGAGTLAAGSFKKYDFATNTWTTLAITGLPASLATDGRLLSTPSWLGSTYAPFASGTATSASATTLVNTPKTWTVNQWTNSQVRIVSGTGAGQIRAITSNTANTLTVPTWTITPDATSVYEITGNDDYLYYMGNGAVTLYRYSITANAWTTLAPTAARAAAPGAGLSGHWVWGATPADWTNESAIKNGRYLYSFRGGAVAANPLDQYDIALNTWVSGIVNAPATETFTTGTKYVYSGDYLYMQKDATGRWFRYSFPDQGVDGWTTMLYTQGAAVVGDTAFDATYVDGATSIQYIYMLLNTSTVMLRQLVI
jgi:hypothetical protein